MVTALDTSSLFRGEEVEQFESAISEYAGGYPPVTVSSGTAAVHLALLVSGVEPSDDVLMPTLRYVAPTNTGSLRGAHRVRRLRVELGELDVPRAEAFIERNYAIRDGL